MTDRISLEGLDKIQLKLAFMQDPDTVINATREGAVHLKSVIAVYPRKPAHSAYIRTGNLGKRWAINKLKLGASLTNNTSYGPFVQGESQTDFHAATGWKTTKQVSESESGVILELLRQAIRKALRK